ncbi:MAG: twin-arginine translocase TatA/TatE family subunit [Vulcanimicrobiaceae bacterium]
MIFKRSLPVLWVRWWCALAVRVDANRCTDEGRNPLLSPADVLILGAAALLFFGPEQLPKVARKVGHVVRDVQTTSQAFVREMERAADEAELLDRTRETAPRHEAQPPEMSPRESEPEAEPPARTG